MQSRSALPLLLAPLLGLASLLACGDSANPVVDDDDSGTGSIGGSSSSGGSSGATSSGGSSSGGRDGGSSGSSGGGRDGGSSGSSGSSGDGGGGGGDAGDGGGGGGRTPVTIKANAAPLGITTDGYLAYQAAGAANAVSLEVVPVAGGAATVLVPALGEDDGFLVVGNAVYMLSVVNNVATLKVWTKAAGVKDVATNIALDGPLSFSSDGSRVVFATGVGAAATRTLSLGVATSAGVATAGVITNVNVQAENCEAAAGFAGNLLHVTYCTGTDAAAASATLSVVRAGEVTSSNLATGVIPGSVVGAPDGSRVAGRLVASSAGRAWLTANGGATVTLENNVAAVYSVSATGAVFGTSTGVLKKGTVAGANDTVTELAPAARGWDATSPDGTFGLFYTTAPAAQSGYTDVKLANLTAGGAPGQIATAAYALGFTPTGNHVIFLDGFAQAGENLKVKPAAAAERTLATAYVFSPDDGLTLEPVPGSSKFVFADNLQVANQQIAGVDLKIADAAAGAAQLVVAGAVPPYAVGATHAAFVKGGSLQTIALP